MPLQDSNRLIAQIGDYGKENNAINQLSDAGKSALYKGCVEKPNPNEHREQFINYIDKLKTEGNLAEFTGNPDIRATQPEKATITIENLLGKEGLKLYLSALKEEANDKKYRTAVFEASSKGYEGKQWQERPVVIVSGPSGSGKSFAADAAVRKASEFLKTNENNTTNFVVASDGGVAREMSQMRKLMIRVANDKGFSGVKDLHNKSAVLGGIKNHVYDAANASNNLGLVIPETFSKWYLPGKDSKKMMKQAEKQPESRLIFTKVAGQVPSLFQKVVAFMGSRRAWKTDFKEGENETFDLNSTKSIKESKKYGASGFTHGVNGSNAAEKWFKEHSKQKLMMTITNDLVLMKPDVQNTENWVRANQNDSGAIMLPQRAVDAWERSDKTDSLEDFYKATKNNYPPIVETSMQIDLASAIKKLSDLQSTIDLQESQSKIEHDALLDTVKTALQSLEPIHEKSIESIDAVKQTLNEHLKTSKSEKKWLFLDTKTTKAVNRALKTLDRIEKDLPKVQRELKQTGDEKAPHQDKTAQLPPNLISPMSPTDTKGVTKYFKDRLTEIKGLAAHKEKDLEADKENAPSIPQFSG
ncbi:MAG: hypothetical protein JJT82_08850 [Legionellaceae bacterium]|nr:hypothetical protein [Legionellaceae bacterium]